MQITSSLVTSTTVSEFPQAVVAASYDHLIVVDFWADWCGPCKALAPILELVAEARANRIRLVKVDVDAEPGLALDHGIRALPTIAFFRDGELVSQLVGLQSREAILRAVDEHLAR